MIGRDAISISSAFSFKAWLSFLLLACSLLLQSPGGHAQNSLAAALQQQSEFLPVRDAYRLDGAVTGDGQLRLYWQIAEGYNLSQHMFKVMHAEASTRRICRSTFHLRWIKPMSSLVMSRSITTRPI